MFTPSGEKIQVESKIEGGFLGRKMYYGYVDDINGVSDYEEPGSDVLFFKTLHEEAPTQIFDEKVHELKIQREKLTKEIESIKEKKRQESVLRTGISKYQIIETLYRYMTKDFNFVLFIKDLSWKESGNFYATSNVRTAFLKGGWSLFAMSNKNYISSDDREFKIFSSKKEMDLFSKELLLERIKSWNPNYNKSQGLKNLMSKVDRNCSAKKDEEVIVLYEQRIKELEEAEWVESQKKIDEKIKELESLKKTKSNEPK